MTKIDQSINQYTMFHKKHPFSSFHNSVKCWSIYTKICTGCSWRNTNSKYLVKIWLL